MCKKKKYSLISALQAVCLIIILFIITQPSIIKNETSHKSSLESKVIDLPEPCYESETSLEKTLLERRSVIEYDEDLLSLSDISQILWVAQGITYPGGHRTALSAGALYALELFLVTGNINDLPKGVYGYLPEDHKFDRVLEGDKGNDLFGISLRQSAIKGASAVLVFSAVYDKTTVKNGDRGIRYVRIEVGHAAENAFLQAVALNLKTIVIGAFYDEEVKDVLNMSKMNSFYLYYRLGRSDLINRPQSGNVQYYLFMKS